MAYYNSLKSLGDNTLKQGDIVNFVGIEYIVTMNYLRNQNPKNLNDQIFDKLNIESKYSFCSSCYGYTVTTGIWPEYGDYDFPAVTRLVKALFKIIEDKAMASEKSEESKEIATSELFKEESKLSVLLPSKHRNIKQIEIQKEITFNKL